MATEYEGDPRRRCIEAAINDPAVIRAFNDDDPFDTLVMRIVDAALGRLLVDGRLITGDLQKQYGSEWNGRVTQPDGITGAVFGYTYYRYVGPWQPVSDIGNDDELVCGAYQPGAPAGHKPYRCSEDPGHEGDHRAVVDGSMLALWPRVGNDRGGETT